MQFVFSARSVHAAGACCLVLGGACSDQAATGGPTGATSGATVVDPTTVTAAPSGRPTGETLAAVRCTADVPSRTVRCGEAANVGPDGEPYDIFGAQGVYVRLASSNPSYVGTTFGIDVTVENLMNEAIGTPGGGRADPNGIRVFFEGNPTATGGTGTVTVANPDGIGTFTATNQPYYQYNQILVTNAVSASKRWQFVVPNTVTSFTFQVYVSTLVQPLLVINELLSNPGGTISDATGEWFEVTNIGTRAVNMQGYLIADSAASGIRPFHIITASLVVAPGAYVTFGNTTNTTNNGGVPIDYAYGNAMAFANSLDALKISRQVGPDTTAANVITIDYVRYASAAISAQNGISRELTNPLLDNLNVDGTNWADALVTAVYGPGGRGTPKAQNSTYLP